MNRYLCIHGHFYQPPRENAWLEEIKLQESAHPYRDWNERITAECYAPNAASRILDSEKRIIDIVNNYSKISFNFGPTLLSWMEKSSPENYAAVLKADKISQENFSGHGAAMAQPYNHMIMPLANDRDKRTQVFWGISDFEYRFKRRPAGMWLPETAVDLATLDVLAEYGIKFTVLAPHQAKKIRKIGDEVWKDVSNGRVNPQRAYLCPLPSGRNITLFFYDGPISQEVAFSNLLKNGESFAKRLVGIFPSGSQASSLVHIASDGETYGHHHRFGNMALSYCLHHIENKKLAKLTVYDEYLEKYPPEYEVEITEETSWSCLHKDGLARWRNDSGSYFKTDNDHKWRAPLREALDWLRDQLIGVFEEEMDDFLNDPWVARDQYIGLILNRSDENTRDFLSKHAKRELSPEEKIKTLKLLEMQRHAMYMFTSCGWFFEDVSRIETIQILQYAARAMQLAKEVGQHDFEEEFVEKLSLCQSQVLELENGKNIYQQYVRPAVVGFLNVGAHYAISSLFEKYPKTAKIYSYTAENKSYELHSVGIQKLVIGRVNIRSMVTWEESLVDFIVLHLGDHNFNGGVRFQGEDGSFNEICQPIKKAFLNNNITKVINLMQNHFGPHTYSLWDLFENEQGKVLNQVLEHSLKSIETYFREIYERYYPLMQLKDHHSKVPLPKALSMTVEFVLNRDLIELLQRDQVDLYRLENTAREIQQWSFTRDKEMLGFVASERINYFMGKFNESPENLDLLQNIEGILKIMKLLSLDLDLWKAQNVYFSVSRRLYDQMLEKAKQQQSEALQWVGAFETLGRYLQVKVT